MSEIELQENVYVATERIYEQQGRRTVLVATPGDVLSIERAEELGLVGKKKGSRKTGMPVINEPMLTEGQEPIDSPEADARATGDTAEAKARGGVEPAPSPSVTVTGPVMQDRPKATIPRDKARRGSREQQKGASDEPRDKAKRGSRDEQEREKAEEARALLRELGQEDDEL